MGVWSHGDHAAGMGLSQAPDLTLVWLQLLPAPGSKQASGSLSHLSDTENTAWCLSPAWKPWRAWLHLLLPAPGCMAAWSLRQPFCRAPHEQDSTAILLRTPLGRAGPLAQPPGSGRPGDSTLTTTFDASIPYGHWLVFWLLHSLLQPGKAAEDDPRPWALHPREELEIHPGS